MLTVLYTRSLQEEASQEAVEYQGFDTPPARFSLCVVLAASCATLLFRRASSEMRCGVSRRMFRPPRFPGPAPVAPAQVWAVGRSMPCSQPTSMQSAEWPPEMATTRAGPAVTDVTCLFRFSRERSVSGGNERRRLEEAQW